MNNPRTILIIKTGALGDLVLASVFFQTVKDNFPDSRLYLLTHERYRGVVEACPLFEEVFALTDRFADDGRTIRKIRRRRMDMVLDFQGGLKTNFWALFSGARVRAGVYESILGGLVFSTRVRRVSDLKLGPVESQYPLLLKLGLSRFDSRLRVWVTATDRAAFPAAAARLGITATCSRVVIHPGSSGEWPSKRWPDENYTDLAEAMAADRQVVFVGQAADRDWIDSLIRGMKHPAINAAGRTTFAQLYQLLEGAALVVTTDSAPLHLAAAAGARTIALFGPTDPGRHCPPGPTVLFHPGPCGPCYRKQCARRACLKSITVAEVLEVCHSSGW